MKLTRECLVEKRLPVRLNTIEKFAGGERIVGGMASTADIDRMGDIVEPLGVQVELPIPLLFQHRHDQVIGKVLEATPSSSGIRIRAQFTDTTAKAREIWELVQDGFLDSFSIGFRALEREPLKSGGWRFTQSELLEVSVVSVPANSSAKIGKGLYCTGAVKLIRPGAVKLTRCV